MTEETGGYSDLDLINDVGECLGRAGALAGDEACFTGKAGPSFSR